MDLLIEGVGGSGSFPIGGGIAKSCKNVEDVKSGVAPALQRGHAPSMELGERILENLVQDVRNLRSDALSQMSVLRTKIDAIDHQLQQHGEEIKAIKAQQATLSKEQAEEKAFGRGARQSWKQIGAFASSIALLSSAVAGAVASVLQFLLT